MRGGEPRRPGRTAPLPPSTVRYGVPIRYHIDPARGLVRVRIEGAVTRPEFRAYRRALEADPAYSGAYVRLLDTRLLETIPDQAFLQQFLRSRRTLPGAPFGRRAIVTGREVMYGVFRMLESMAEPGPVEYRVFRTPAEAVEWLGLPAEAADDEEGG